MSGLFSALRFFSSPPVEDDDTVERKEESVDEDGEEPVPPPPIPSRRRSVLDPRTRSLSKVFTQVPLSVPDLKHMQMDQIEYLCHLCLLETSPNRILKFSKELLQLLESHRLPSHGRLFSRIMICGLALDMSYEVGSSHGKSELRYSWDHKADFWKSTAENLIHAKSMLLRKDANKFVPSQMEGYEDDVEEAGDCGLDHDLEQHEMMKETYKEVLELVRLQHQLAELRDAVEDKEDILVMKESLPAPILEVLEAAKGQDLMLVLEEMAHASDKKEFSHAHVQQKMKSLLLKWAESILQIPELVRLGYGGVMAPIVEEEGADDVSSWGDEEHALMSQSDNVARRRSITSPQRAIRRGPAKDLGRVIRSNMRREQEKEYESPLATQKPADDDFPAEDDDHGEPEVLAVRSSAKSKAPRSSGTKRKTPPANQPVSRRIEWDSPTGGSATSSPRRKPMQRRRGFSQAEVEAILEGLDKFGVGKWAEIKAASGGILDGRTSVQIKDKYRTMLKRGVIKEADFIRLQSPPRKTRVVDSSQQNESEKDERPGSPESTL